MKFSFALNWKTAAVPLAVVTGAFAVGIGRFAGSPPGEEPAAGAAAEPAFARSGAVYPPGRTPAAAAGEQASSIDLLRRVNRGFYSESASGRRAMAPAVKPRNKAEMDDFLRQLRHEINYDKEAGAQAQAETSAPSPSGPGRRVQNPAGLGTGPGRAASAVRSGALPRLSPPSAFNSGGGRSTFAADFSGNSAPSVHGASAARQQREADLAAGGGSTDLSAGSYGSARGQESSGQDQAGQGGGGAGMNSGGASSSGGGAALPKASGPKAGGEAGPPPAPIALIWPRSTDFGDMKNYETAVRLVTVMNVGDLPLSIGLIENIDDSSHFGKEDDHCSGATLAPNRSCTFLLRFTPRAAKEHVTAFYVPTNDEDSAYFQTYMEVKGKAASSQWASWWSSHWGGAGQGTVNRADFGLVPEGRSLSEVIRITNTGGRDWYGLKLDASGLPADFRITGDGCTGSALGAGQSCAVTVKYTPTEAVGRRFASMYGQYLAVNTATNQTVHSARPKFPPLLLEKPVEGEPSGKLKVLASFSEYSPTAREEVLRAEVKARTTAPFPVPGLTRVQVYYYFKN